MITGKKYLLVVQGEGRGHITQAMSMYDLLIERGNEVCAVILGSSGKREVPHFFLEKIKAPVYQIQSPNFVTDKKNKSIRIVKSVVHNFSKLRSFKASLRTIDEIIKEHKPEVVINFFDLLMGLYFRFYKPSTKMVCIAHQYIYFHQDFEFPRGYFMDRMAIKFFTRLTSTRSSKNIALSFYKIHTNCRDVVVVPPLLRKELFKLETANDDYYLVYLVNNGYYEEIIKWHEANPDVVLHCFTDQPAGLLDLYPYKHPNLQLHPINDQHFLEKMSHASGLASSAGFESICEAMFLGKPVLVVPIAGHFEQLCNSIDAVKAGAGVFEKEFNLTRLVKIGRGIKDVNPVFKNWVTHASDRIYNEVSTF